jgi:ornithine carbamoyltransferase
MKHFISFHSISRKDILDILALSKKIKIELKNNIHIPYLDKYVLGMIFEKSSTRTRVSFETGIYQLGGQGLFLSSRDIQLGRGEPVSDTAQVISSMVNMLMVRTFEHAKIEEFAKFSRVPVINGLTDLCHPLQILADYLTILENGIEDPTIAYVGDGNNMANSWILFAKKMGIELRIATPKGYEPNSEILKLVENNANIKILNSPKEAVKDADVVTTDTWISMGQEAEKEKRIKDFQGFKVDSDLMQLAKPTAIFLHCLPAYRGYEVSDEVIDGSQSRIYQEAENRLHTQKGVMLWLKESQKTKTKKYL